MTKNPLTAMAELEKLDKKKRDLLCESSQRCANKILNAKKNLKKSKQL